MRVQHDVRFTPKTDIRGAKTNVRFGPEADIEPLITRLLDRRERFRLTSRSTSTLRRTKDGKTDRCFLPCHPHHRSAFDQDRRRDRRRRPTVALSGGASHNA